MLTEHLDDLRALAHGLLEYETLDSKEVEMLLRGEAIDRGDDTEDKPSGGKRSSVPSSGASKDKDIPGGPMGPEPEPAG